MLNQTRTIYRRMLDRNKLSPADQARAIKMGSELEALVGNPGWQHVMEFIEKSKSGTHAMMEKEVQVVRGWTMVSLFGAFAKYLMLLFENRAYNKIKMYVDVSIQNGKKLAAARAKREGRE